MEINKVDLLLKYILASSGQEDYGNREVGPIYLIKYVYSADLAFAEKHGPPGDFIIMVRSPRGL